MIDEQFSNTNGIYELLDELFIDNEWIQRSKITQKWRKMNQFHPFYTPLNLGILSDKRAKKG